MMMGIAKLRKMNADIEESSGVGLCTEAKKRQRGAFTLLELLIVMALISAIAALGLGSMKFALNKGASSKTKALMKMVELGLEKYQLENGEYPEFGGTGTPTLSTFDSKGSWLLYEVITGDGDKSKGGTNAANGDIDTNETPLLDDVFTGNDDKFSYVEKDSAGNFVLVDGWGNPLQYRRADETDYIERNGTYDLWSYGTVEDGVAPSEESWIKNW